jgi:hypothetical protein
MHTTTKVILAICCIGAVAVETLAPVYSVSLIGEVGQLGR